MNKKLRKLKVQELKARQAVAATEYKQALDAAVERFNDWVEENQTEKIKARNYPDAGPRWHFNETLADLGAKRATLGAIRRGLADAKKK